MVTRRWWAGARGSPRSKRLLVARTSQAGELLGIQLDLINAPQTDLRVPARGPWCPGVEVLASDVALESHMPNYWSRHGVCVGWLLLGRRRTVVPLEQKARQEG